MSREYVYSIYKKLNDSEKSAWAKELGYRSVSGLRNYLKTDKEDARDGMLEALAKVVGLNRTKELNIKLTTQSQFIQNKLIDYILASSDEQEIEQIREKINLACDSQVSRIKLMR